MISMSRCQSKGNSEPEKTLWMFQKHIFNSRDNIQQNRCALADRMRTLPPEEMRSSSDMFRPYWHAKKSLHRVLTSWVILYCAPSIGSISGPQNLLLSTRPTTQKMFYNTATSHTNLERAHEGCIDAHHCSSIVEFTAIVWRWKQCEELTLGEEFVAVFDDLHSFGKASKNITAITAKSTNAFTNSKSMITLAPQWSRFRLFQFPPALTHFKGFTLRSPHAHLHFNLFSRTCMLSASCSCNTLYLVIEPRSLKLMCTANVRWGK